MDADDLFSIVNAPSGSLTPSSGRGIALASAFLSPGGVPVGVASSTLSDKPTQWGPSLVLIRDHTKICGGQYGVKKNNCFCCAVDAGTSKGCPGRHVVVKHWMTDTTSWVNAKRLYLHKGASSGAAYAEPFVDVSDWKEEEVASILGRSFGGWDEWREEALVLQASRASTLNAAVIKTAIKKSKKLPRLKVPMEEGDDPDSVLYSEPKEDANLLDTADKLEELLQVKSIAEGETFGPGIIERINLLRTSLLVLGDSTSDKLKELQVGFGIRVQGLEAQIGISNPTGVMRRLEGASIWSMLEDLQLQVEEIRKPDFIRSIGAAVLKTEPFDKHMTTVKEAFKRVMERILPMETRLDEMGISPHDPGSLDGLHWLGAGRSNPSSAMNKDIDDKVQALSSRVGTLELTMNPSHKGDGEDVLVSFMGVRFSSEDDVRSYVEALDGGRFNVTPGLVTDCYAIFHALNREIFDSKSRLSLVDLAKVANLGTKQADVYHLLAASEHGLPAFFDSPASAGKIYIDGKQGKKHRFSNIASYEIWGPVGTIKEAIRRQAEVHLTRFVKTRRLAIQELGNPELSAFLTAMLNASKDFVEAVFTFLTEEYSALAEHFSDGALCWDFACSCIEHVFKYEFEAARAVITSPDVGDASIHPKVLWQSLRTISVQESFLRVGFKNHSSLASAYSRFLLTQYQRTALELAKVSKEAEGYKTKLGAVTNLIEALDKRVRAAEGTANAAKNALDKIVRKDGRNGSS
jgi:hypothetical protein